jgi:transposase
VGRRLAARATPVVATLTTTSRGAPVVPADETGWRENGRNGSGWTFSTPQHRLVRHGSRARTMVPDVVGGPCGGVLVSDVSAASTGNAGVHQFCWAHLLRDGHALTAPHPDDAVLAGWATAVHAVVTRAQTGASGRRGGACARMLRHEASLVVGVTEPDVPATTNAAERSLRPLVVSRTISGGTRSAQARRRRCGWRRCSAPGARRASPPITPAVRCWRPHTSEQLLRYM